MDPKFKNYTWPADCPRTNAEFDSYPQFSNDHFGYRMVRITHAWELEKEINELKNIKVKPLIWVHYPESDEPTHPGVHIGQVNDGIRFYIQSALASGFQLTSMLNRWMTRPTEHPTVDEAKSVAQAQWEAFIKGALL